MYLKSVTLKGFKSFADPTTIDLEPGVTVVVGPNGSGKSNVVDAVAWVLGAQGPRVVRSAKMDDVIFAGSATRAPLGRAEVSIVIDNTSRRLPIEFAEVTVTRTLFRTGESEYAINAVPCRLLDVQELFSDTGVGRQQHVIIGQGQLDSVLGARPEDRRTIIEEAAGVLKFRRRRERAERRLASSEESMTRLEDVLREVRRQLRPLERQAAAALRHEELSAEHRSLAGYVAGREIEDLDSLVERETVASREVRSEHEALASRAALVAGEIRDLEASEDQIGDDGRRDLIAALDRTAERARGLIGLIAERKRSNEQLALALDEAPISSLEAAIDRVTHEREQTEATRAELGRELEQAVAEEKAAGALMVSTFADADDRLSSLDTRTSVARSELEATIALLGERESHLRATRSRLAGLSDRRGHVESAREHHRLTLDALEASLALAEAEQVRMDASARAAREHLGATALARQASEHDRSVAEARVEFLSIAIDEARARAGVDRLAGNGGVLGTLLDVVEVDEGVELAFEAAVEGLLDAVVIEDAIFADDALRRLKGAGHAAAVLVAGGERISLQPRSRAGALLIDNVRATVASVSPLLSHLVGHVVLCRDGFSSALALASKYPEATIVTLEGDRFSPRSWRLSAGAVGATEGALEAARQALVASEERCAVTRRESEAAARRERELADEYAKAVSARERVEGEIRAELSASQRTEREIDSIAADIATVMSEDQRTTEAVASAAAGLDEARSLVSLLEAERGHVAREHQAREENRQLLEVQIEALVRRRREIEVRSGAIAERSELLEARERELVDELDGRRRSEASRQSAERQSADARWLEAMVSRLVGLDQALSARSGALRVRAEDIVLDSRRRIETLVRLRTERDRITEATEQLREKMSSTELSLVELRVRREGLVERLERDFSITVTEARSLPAPELEGGGDPLDRVRSIERELAALGPVNPLARIELAELAERSAFLETQLSDVKSARRELHHVIEAVDAQIIEVFREAYADVSMHFEKLITTLFPGGSGALSLTAPDDLLTTGVEIEARPPGRNVRRLSLLSGGERALVALAFLFAVFRSRPSPFYLMDEVEAALDEANLRRFLDLLEEFRGEAQLIVVSHQKKTMEVADLLYGITLQPGGSSKVVSERLVRSPVQRDSAPAVSR